MPEGEKGPFISLLLIVWFPVAAGELVVLQGKERRPTLAQELVRSHFICLQTLRWLRAIPLSLELCRNTKRWHLTASAYQFLFLSSPFFYTLRHLKLLPTPLQRLSLFVLQPSPSQVEDNAVCSSSYEENHPNRVMPNRKSWLLKCKRWGPASVCCWFQCQACLCLSRSCHQLVCIEIQSSHPALISVLTPAGGGAVKVLVCKLLWERWHIYDEQCGPNSLRTAGRGRFSPHVVQRGVVHCELPSGHNTT